MTRLKIGREAKCAQWSRPQRKPGWIKKAKEKNASMVRFLVWGIHRESRQWDTGTGSWGKQCFEAAAAGIVWQTVGWTLFLHLPCLFLFWALFSCRVRLCVANPMWSLLSIYVLYEWSLSADWMLHDYMSQWLWVFRISVQDFMKMGPLEQWENRVDLLSEICMYVPSI